MAPHLLAVSAEIRLEIWKLFLQDAKIPVFITAQTGNHVEDLLFFDEVLYERDFKGAIAWKRGPTSVVFTCRQLAAEVLPLFRKRVCVQFEDNLKHLDIEPEDIGLRLFDMADFMRTPKYVQDLSIPKHLSEHMAYCSGQTENPNIYVKNILPSLMHLIIYEELSVFRNPDSRARNDENMAVRAKNTVENMYEETQDTESDLCYFIFPEREYTIMHQLLMGNGFVCVATWAPGLTFKDFVYEFKAEYEALVSLDDMACPD